MISSTTNGAAQPKQTGATTGMRDLFKASPNKKFTRAELMAKFASNPGSANSTIHKLYSDKFIARVGDATYQLARKGVRNIPPNRKPPNRKAAAEAKTQEGKRKYMRKSDLLALDPAAASARIKDSTVYLSQARAAMPKSDSKEYLLVSLALFTLQGKM